MKLLFSWNLMEVNLPSVVDCNMYDVSQTMFIINLSQTSLLQKRTIE